MTPQERKVIELALEALEGMQNAIYNIGGEHVEALNYAVKKANVTEQTITTIKEALAKPNQEPVAWMSEDEREAFERFNETCEDGEGYDVPKTMMRRLAEIGVIHHTSRGIYGITKFGRLLVGKTTPPQRKPLTEEQMDAMIDGCPKYHGRFSTKDPDGKLNYYELIRAIEAAHGIKE